MLREDYFRIARGCSGKYIMHRGARVYSLGARFGIAYEMSKCLRPVLASEAE